MAYICQKIELLQKSHIYHWIQETGFRRQEIIFIYSPFSPHPTPHTPHPTPHAPTTPHPTPPPPHTPHPTPYTPHPTPHTPHPAPSPVPR
ncbi:hypothetical protein [Microcystis sp. M169S2]|uniref:hypothetical protein n=1 Tax=Microcystis sp. M169S2 TaxID=2771157 RepID=UPI00258FB7A5|nr:hypothetical protein [Microcystis sp. M169S2]